MGNRCNPSEGGDWIGLGLMGLAVLFVGWTNSAVGKGTDDLAALVTMLFSFAVILVGAPLDAYDYLSISNPQLLMPCLEKWRVKAETELEKLEIVHKKALEYSEEAFKSSLSGWILSGLALAFAEVALWKGWLLWVAPILITLIIVSISGTVSFVLMIISYLRKRSIEKALFAIQLKKSDKAEISIKI